MCADMPDVRQVSVVPGRLRKRSEFLATAKGKRVHSGGFTLQGQVRQGQVRQGQSQQAVDGARFGFTVTKKVGSAVVRNRIRRRLKEALRLLPGLAACSDHDYVLVARLEALKTPFAQLQQELSRSVSRLHNGPKPLKTRAIAPDAGGPTAIQGSGNQI